MSKLSARNWTTTMAIARMAMLGLSVWVFAAAVAGCCGKKSSSSSTSGTHHAAATEACKSMPGPATCEACCHKNGATNHVHTKSGGCRCY